MQTRTDPVALVARAVLLALTTVVAGVTGHLAVSGAPPSAGVVVLLAAAAFVVCLRVLRHPAGGARIVAVLLGGQALVHLALAATSGAVVAGGTRMASGAMALPVSGGRRVGSLQDSHDVATGHVDLGALRVSHLVTELPHHGPTVLAHLLVAAALGLALALGEGCLWTLVALLAHVVLRLLTPLLLVPARLVPAPAAALARLPHLLHLLAPSVVRRGPPVAHGVA